MKRRIFAVMVAVTMALTTLAVPAFAAKTTAPKAPVLKSVAASYKALTARWDPVKDAKGYEVYYKKSKVKGNRVTVEGKTAKKLTGLEAGVKYRVKVRSYIVSNGAKVYSSWSDVKTNTTETTNWTALKNEYKDMAKVKELIFVKYKGNSQALLILYKKNAENEWDKQFSCTAYTGQNGINKVKEGDRKTPTGKYKLDCAFGIKKDPGSLMPYTKVDKNLYWCGDKKYYNTMIDIRKKPHTCRGEHLIDYTKQYAYAMNISYNSDGVYGKGSAIFLHCFGYNKYTLGCIAISEANMKTIMQTCEKETRICIYPR